MTSDEVPFLKDTIKHDMQYFLTMTKHGLERSKNTISTEHIIRFIKLEKVHLPNYQ